MVAVPGWSESQWRVLYTMYQSVLLRVTTERAEDAGASRPPGSFEPVWLTCAKIHCAADRGSRTALAFRVVICADKLSHWHCKQRLDEERCLLGAGIGLRFRFGLDVDKQRTA